MASPNNSHSINVRGKLIDFSEPKIMGILNVTPDSFYAESRKTGEADICTHVEKMIEEGVDIIDVGGYSSRPNAKEVSPQEELKRLSVALKIISKEFPEAIVSVDTFRSETARACVEKYGVAIVNDISGGTLDPCMFETIAALKMPYILSHIKGNPTTMEKKCRYDDLIFEIILYFSNKINQLHCLGVNDLIIDPGFGFAKDMEQNYLLMKHIEALQVFDLPILVGISRKRMIYELLGHTPQESLNGATVLNTYALLHGVVLLRVHDVKEAKEIVKIVKKLNS